MQPPPPSIQGLSGLGPQSQAMLARAGITSLPQLQALGSMAAFVQTRRAHPGRVSLNLLWALEAALASDHWQNVARHHRTRLLMALEAYETCNPATPSAP